METNAPKISPVTSKMLQAFKVLNEARSQFFEAMKERGGKEYAAKVDEANAAKWESVEGLIKGEIAWSVDVWASGGSDTI